MKWRVNVNSKDILVDLPDAVPDNEYFTATISGKTLQVRYLRNTKTLFIQSHANSNAEAVTHVRTVAVQKFANEPDSTVALEFVPHGAFSAVCAEANVGLFLPGQEGRSSTRKKASTVRSQMTGKVLKIFVSAGQTVEAGSTLMIIEAMKMENRVITSTAAKVASILVKEGDSVQSGVDLVKFSDE
jgi:biotin carboxyl carrier protein